MGYECYDCGSYCYDGDEDPKVKVERLRKELAEAEAVANRTFGEKAAIHMVPIGVGKTARVCRYGGDGEEFAPIESGSGERIRKYIAEVIDIAMKAQRESDARLISTHGPDFSRAPLAKKVLANK